MYFQVALTIVAYDVDVGSEKVSPVLFVRRAAKKGTSRGHHRHRERG